MNRSPRVLVSGVCLGQAMGGVRRHSAELLPRVDALLRADGGGLAILEGRTPLALDLPGEIQRLSSDVPFQPAPRRALFEARALASAIRAAARAGRPFDLVHTAHLPAPRGLDLPTTLTLHDLRSLDLDRAPFVRRLLGGRFIGRAIAEARRVFTVSDAMRSRIVGEFPAAEGKIDVVGNGADHLPLVPRAPAAPPFLLHVGHIEPRKNLELLVRALAHDPALPRVLLAGASKGDELARLHSLARELGVSERLEARDGLDDEAIARLYATAACAVFPSRLEGFGIGPAEAIRAGCPVAVSAIPAHLEVAGKRAAVFAPTDEGALAEAVATARGVDSGEGAAGMATWTECAERWASGLRAAFRDEAKSGED